MVACRYSRLSRWLPNASHGCATRALVYLPMPYGEPLSHPLSAHNPNISFQIFHPVTYYINMEDDSETVSFPTYYLPTYCPKIRRTTLSGRKRSYRTSRRVSPLEERMTVHEESSTASRLSEIIRLKITHGNLHRSSPKGKDPTKTMKVLHRMSRTLVACQIAIIDEIQISGGLSRRGSCIQWPIWRTAQWKRYWLV